QTISFVAAAEAIHAAPFTTRGVLITRPIVVSVPATPAITKPDQSSIRIKKPTVPFTANRGLSIFTTVSGAFLGLLPSPLFTIGIVPAPPATATAATSAAAIPAIPVTATAMHTVWSIATFIF
ncbi:hypothetical protein Vretimale_14554, partial [Volvox reticuliferus]